METTMKALKAAASVMFAAMGTMCLICGAALLKKEHEGDRKTMKG